MLFLTNRVLQQGNHSQLNRSVTFDLSNNAACNAVFYCRRNSSGNYTEIGSREFMAQLKQSHYEQVLFYIHGFNNLPEENIFPTTEALQYSFDRKSPGQVLVVPIIWPCDNDMGVVKDYWDDQKSADMSGFAFSRALNKFRAWSLANSDIPCLKRISVLSHSMGCRVLRETLRVWQHYDMPLGLPKLFCNVFAVAADLVNETLERSNAGALFAEVAKHVLVYYAGDDLALRGSKVLNLRNAVASRRLGHSGPEDLAAIPKNVFAIDCDEINCLYDHPLGHTYFLSQHYKSDPGIVFDHIYATLDSGRVPMKNFSRHSMHTDERELVLIP